MLVCSHHNDENGYIMNDLDLPYGVLIRGITQVVSLTNWLVGLLRKSSLCLCLLLENNDGQ